MVVVLGKALLLFAVLIIRNHMEKNLWLCWQIQNGFGFIFPIFTICVITAMIKISEDIKNKPGEFIFVIAWIGGNEHSCIFI